MADEQLLHAVQELKDAIREFRADLQSRDAEIVKLREALADRDARIRGLGDQALHLLELLQEARARAAEKK